MDIFVWLISVMIFSLVIAFWVLFLKLEEIEKRLEIGEKRNGKAFLRVDRTINLIFEEMGVDLVEEPKRTVLKKAHFTGKQHTDNHRENSKNEDTA